MRLILALAFTCGVALTPAIGNTSEWGCEVLLCVLSSNPSWKGVPSCRPPMNRLLSAMRRPGFSWPICAEAGTGRPGYEEYADCPTGWLPAAEARDYGHGQGLDMSRCSHAADGCRTTRSRQDSTTDELATGPRGGRQSHFSSDSCRDVEYMPRPRREEPYYFDIGDEKTGSRMRHFFSLQR